MSTSTIRFPSQESYAAALTDARLWKPLVREVLSHHGFGAGKSVRAGAAGTFPTMLIDHTLVVKFFGPLFDGKTCAGIEREIYALLANNAAIPAPQMLAYCTLFADSDWPWEYIVSSQLPDISYGQVRGDLTTANRGEVARFAADITDRLSRLTPSAEPPGFLAQSDWGFFVQNQKRACVTQHRAWGSLPHALVEQIDNYLDPLETIAPTMPPPVLIHADLTADHILGSWHGATWIPTGIIDFGDARIGDRIYDLVALHIECFACERAMLQTFAAATSLVLAGPDFSRHAMQLTLLHEFDVLRTVFERHPEARTFPSLDDLARFIWSGVRT